MQSLDQVTSGSHVLLGGHLHRHARHTALGAGPHAVRLLGEPFMWLPEHGQRVEVWGELLSAAPPVVLVHGARPLGSAAAILPPMRPQEGLFGRHMSVTEHGTGLLGTTTERHVYLLSWPQGRAGLHLVTGYVGSLSPPRLTVVSATRLWLADSG